MRAVSPVGNEQYPLRVQNKTSSYLKKLNTPTRKSSRNHFRLHFTPETPQSFKLFDTRSILSTLACDSCSTENNRQSNKKEILTNSQDKKYNSMKHLIGQQSLFTTTCII